MPRSASISRASGGRYRKIRHLATGGTAVVDLVEDTLDQSVWVAKAYRLAHSPDWKGWELFERGAKIMASLDHPGIPRFRELIRSDDPGLIGLWLIEEYVPGQSLRQFVEADGPVPVAHAVRLTLALLSILEHLHARTPPIVHRDVKPSNVLVRPDGRLCLVDFGAVQQALRHCTMGGSTVVGTYGYMPPEQFMGRAEPASDLYAVGATLLYLVAGRDPGDFPVREMRVDYRKGLRNDRLADALDQLMEPRVEKRVATTTAAAEVLRSLLGPPKPAPKPAAQGGGLPTDLAAFIEAADPGGELEVVGEQPAEPIGPCPSCGGELAAMRRGKQNTEIDFCRSCGGVWLDVGEIDAVLERPMVVRPNLAEIRRKVRAMRRVPDAVVYKKCPRCATIMARRNFGRVSGVIVDECGKHGTWLDAGELDAIQAFVSAGGMELELERRVQQVAEARENVRHARMVDLLRSRSGSEYR